MKTSLKSRSRFWLFFLHTSLAICLLIGILDRQSGSAAEGPVIKNIQIRPPEKIGMSNKDMEKICAAAISILANRPTSAIKIESTELGRLRLSYTSPELPTRQFTCSIAGEKVLLAREDDGSPDELLNERIIFRLTTDEIHITVAYSDGSEEHGRFPR